MAKILLAGAGKSATWLIKYLLENSVKEQWEITIIDGNASLIEEKTIGYPSVKCVALDINGDREREKLVADADIVLSLMPPHLHLLLAKDCLAFRKNLITSSYVSPEIKSLNDDFSRSGIMAMCEMGLDPGIDDMSAHQIIHNIQSIGGEITSFKSYCGGLIAPASDNNPWHYKFSWNPRNIIDAGKAGATFLENGVERNIAYDTIFSPAATTHIDELGDLAWYPNRDSVQYLESYGLPHVTTFLRATLRYPTFCAGWDALRKLDLVDWESAPSSTITTIGALTESLGANKGAFSEGVKAMLAWLGLFSNEPLPARRGSNAEILLQILEEKWAMAAGDRDMVVMKHEIEYSLDNKKKVLTSTLVLEGDNRELSAMAKTVGLPIGLLAKGILNETIAAQPGVHIPNMACVYEPVMRGLQDFGIIFRERVG